MSRQVRDANLETRTARHRLPARKEPHWRLIERGLHLGFRKLANAPGRWIVRRFNGNVERGSPYTIRSLGSQIIADDYSDADGKVILSFAQAQDAAKAYRSKSADDAADGFYTVGQALDDYITHIEHDRDAAAADAARGNIEPFIRPAFGSLEAAKLKTKEIRGWLTKLAKQPPRLRTKVGEKQKFAEIASDKESIRRRRATVNRIFCVLKAALNHAWHEGKIASDAEWRRVKPFKNVGKSRTDYLSVAECKRLLNASAEDFRQIVRAALQTGARYGQLCEVTAGDFNADKGTLRLRSRKGKGIEKTYHAVLTDEGIAFFRDMVAGLAKSDLIFRRANGKNWRPSEQSKAMDSACKHAKINPVGFHQLRHTWASHAIMAGVPLLVVAGNLGHSDGRMVEKHYAHLAPSYAAEAIRTNAPRFGAHKRSNVRVLG